MKVRKAVITAAGRGARLYPAADTVQKSMLPLVDRDGLAKPVIQIIAEEALESGIEEICVVCAPGDETKYRDQLRGLRDNLLSAYKGVEWARLQARRIDDLLQRLHFAVQDEPLGYGHSVACAQEFVGDEPFLLLLNDHLFVSAVSGRRCAGDLIELAKAEQSAATAVAVMREQLVGHYGTLSGRRLPNLPGVYQIERIIEKPSISRAELELLTPGLRVGHYLCLFGMHVLTPAVFEILAAMIRGGERQNGEVQLTPALHELAQRGRFLALEIRGRRYDLGANLGVLRAQVALSLAGQDRHEVLSTLLETLADSDPA